MPPHTISMQTVTDDIGESQVVVKTPVWLTFVDHRIKIIEGCYCNVMLL